jgi:hypothetical protein
MLVRIDKGLEVIDRCLYQIHNRLNNLRRHVDPAVFNGSVPVSPLPSLSPKCWHSRRTWIQPSHIRECTSPFYYSGNNFPLPALKLFHFYVLINMLPFALIILTLLPYFTFLQKKKKIKEGNLVVVSILGGNFWN